MYKSKITDIGPLVEEFRSENVLVIFGEQATPELREMSAVHYPNRITEDEPIKLNGAFKIGNNQYTITQVGADANSNLLELGHVSIYFKDDDEKVLPGAIAVEPTQFPDFIEGDTIEFS